MNITRDSLNIAVVQAESIMFDKDKCIEKATGIIRECAENGAEFVVFPIQNRIILKKMYNFNKQTNE